MHGHRNSSPSIHFVHVCSVEVTCYDTPTSTVQYVNCHIHHMKGYILVLMILLAHVEVGVIYFESSKVMGHICIMLPHEWNIIHELQSSVHFDMAFHLIFQTCQTLIITNISVLV